MFLTLQQFVNAHEVASVGFDPCVDAGLIRLDFGLELQNVGLRFGLAPSCPAFAGRNLHDLRPKLSKHDLDLGGMDWAAGHGHNAVLGENFAVLGQVAKCFRHLASLAGFSHQDLQAGNAVEKFEGKVQWSQAPHHVPLFREGLDGRVSLVHGAEEPHHGLDASGEGPVDQGLHLLPWHGA